MKLEYICTQTEFRYVHKIYKIDIKLKNSNNIYYVSNCKDDWFFVYKNNLHHSVLDATFYGFVKVNDDLKEKCNFLKRELKLERILK
jgi:hypothetical protein